MLNHPLPLLQTLPQQLHFDAQSFQTSIPQLLSIMMGAGPQSLGNWARDVELGFVDLLGYVSYTWNHNKPFEICLFDGTAMDWVRFMAKFGAFMHPKVAYDKKA
jgi:hypothetical protein